MLRINPIRNVNYTLNNRVAFGNGLQTNWGIDVPSPELNMVEGHLLTGFLGTVIPQFQKTKDRANSIQKGLNEGGKLNFVA